MKCNASTPEILRRRLDYNKDTGSLVWIDGQCAGEEAGCIVKNRAGNQYRILSIGTNGRTFNFMVHQAIWAIVTGLWAEEIDHFDGDGLNNVWSNLREVSRSVNNKNHRKQRNNTSGIAGVSWMDRLSKFRSYGTNGNRKQINLGTHYSIFEAACARKSWELSLEFTERHGL